MWILKVKKFTWQEIYEAVMNLIDNSGFVVGNQEIIISAAKVSILKEKQVLLII
ncbi:hypothetical protein [Rickettsia helvetica]|uniref:hypothetical protein n=1 Tax=Rickettsia helvetica TaxID=35789 RepID=UPI0002DC6923